MIYLQHNTEPQSVLIPKTGAIPQGVLQLVLTSTVNKESVTLPISDTGESDLYVTATITLPESFSTGRKLPEGSYEYAVLCEGETMTTGVAWIGEMPATTVVTPNVESNFMQYESE